MLLDLVERSNLTFNIVRHFFCSGVWWPQCWTGEHAIKLCLHNSWSGGGGGGDFWSRIPSSFPRKSCIPHFFHRFPESRFLFSKIHKLKKSRCKLKANKCKMYVDWPFRLIFWIIPVYDKAEGKQERKKRRRRGEGRGGFLPTLFPSPDHDSLPLGLWTTGAVVCDRMHAQK